MQLHSGSTRHRLTGAGCAIGMSIVVLGGLSRASAQDDEPPAEEAPSRPADDDEPAASPESPEEPESPEAGPEEDAEEVPDELADTEDPPSEIAPRDAPPPASTVTLELASPERPAQPVWVDPEQVPMVADGSTARAPGPARPRERSPTVAPTVQRPPPTAEQIANRYRRYPREVVARPVTLPQGVMRFSSNVGFSLAGRGFGFATFGLAAGLHDDFEVGAIPVGWVFLFQFPAPFFYARLRFLAGDVQLSGRVDVQVPTQGDTQIGGAFELAWRAADWFRLHVDLDYQLLFSSPLHQRIGIPVRGVFQAGPNAFTVETGIYIFNDFDDVDVPLLVDWTYAIGALYSGPLMDLSIGGGFADLTNAENAWLIRGRLTFYAYL